MPNTYQAFVSKAPSVANFEWLGAAGSKPRIIDAVTALIRTGTVPCSNRRDLINGCLVAGFNIFSEPSESDNVVDTKTSDIRLFSPIFAC